MPVHEILLCLAPISERCTPLAPTLMSRLTYQAVSTSGSHPLRYIWTEPSAKQHRVYSWQSLARSSSPQLLCLCWNYDLFNQLSMPAGKADEFSESTVLTDLECPSAVLFSIVETLMCQVVSEWLQAKNLAARGVSLPVVST